MASLVAPFPEFTYHPHQDEAVRWMTTREAAGAAHVRGGILADEMGLGKTWMTIGLFLNAVVENTLLLVPPALQPQWSEALTFAGIPHKILGPPKIKGGCGHWTEIAGTKPFAVSLSTYDRAMHNKTFFETATYDRIVCDEGHVFRNGGGTKRFQVLRAIVAPRRWILSGTPIQNHRRDFFNLLVFLGMPIEERLRLAYTEVAATVMLRRTVGDVRETVPSMPEHTPTHHVHPVVMPAGSEEEIVFDALVGRFENAVEHHANAMIILELFLRIRQYVAHPGIYVAAMRRKYGDKYGRSTWTGTASKLAAFAEMLDTTEYKPTIVFGTFKEELDYADVALKNAGYVVYSVRGGMNDARRGAVVRNSKADVEAGKRVAIVVQIVAGGAGLNLQHCSRVVFLSSHWNPAIVDQAVARAYRMGQMGDVDVHHFLLASDAMRNIDRHMTTLHGGKRATAIGVHPKLFCDTAVSSSDILCKLDDVLPKVVPCNGGDNDGDNDGDEDPTVDSSAY